MEVTDEELEAVLRHCRSLADAAEELEATGARLLTAAERALRAWTGPRADEFAAAVAEQETSLAAAGRALRAEADAWAQAWADAVNAQRARHQALAAAEGGVGLLAHRAPGNDQPVPVPGVGTGYRPTGGGVPH